MKLFTFSPLKKVRKIKMQIHDNKNILWKSYHCYRFYYKKHIIHKFQFSVINKYWTRLISQLMAKLMSGSDTIGTENLNTLPISTRNLSKCETEDWTHLPVSIEQTRNRQCSNLRCGSWHLLEQNCIIYQLGPKLNDEFMFPLS